MKFMKIIAKIAGHVKIVKFLFKLSAFSFYACAKSRAPFMHRRVNNSLVKIVPSLHDSLTKILNIPDFCYVTISCMHSQIL